ncbi:MAG: AraC family transcriptional regulator [Victivallales bacterium]|nr:AraC family transcriptional regulator [Victivallales bacterium]
MDNTLNLYVRSYGEFVLYPPDREEIVRNNFGEIFWPIDGKACFRFQNREFIVSPGTAWYYPPASVHDFTPRTRFHYSWFTLAGPDCDALPRLLHIRPGVNPAGGCPAALLRTLQGEICTHTTKHQFNALSIVFKALTLLAMGKTGESHVNDVASEMRSYMELNYGDVSLNVEALADKFNMHRGSASRAFRRAFGISPLNYLMSCRMQQASRLLVDTHCPVADVAHVCGFNSAHYFSCAFRRSYGFSPGEFRTRFQGQRNLDDQGEREQRRD